MRGDGHDAKVVKVGNTHDLGLYNPQTIHGDIVVDGFVVSTYTADVTPSVAHAVLTPMRAVCKAVSFMSLPAQMTSFSLDNGLPTSAYLLIRHLMPNSLSFP